MFLERVLLAFFVSASSFCFSYYWYKKGGPETTQVETSREVAKLVSLRNEVQRKPSKRVIWQSVGRDEVLYLNEAIRTSADAEAVIEFTEEGKEGTRIVLEPDSVVVLEQTDSDLTLDFLKGNVFVAGSGGQGLKIKSGEDTIAVGEGELNLAKSETGEVNLQVVSGKAQIESNGQSVELGEDQSGSLSDGKVNTSQVNLKILKPLSNRRVFVDFEKNEKVQIAWQGLPEGYTLKLFAGPQRSEMREIGDVEFDYEKNELKAPFKVGRVYWRLEASSEDLPEETVKSVVVKNRIVSLLPPRILQPENEEFIVLESAEPTYMFQFANPLRATDMSLQVWPRGQTPTAANTQLTELDGDSFLYRFTKNGDFSAVVSGYILEDDGRRKALQSQPIQFRVQLGQKLVPPELTFPEPLQRLAFQEVAEKGVFLKWEPVPTIKKYEVRVERVVNGKRKIMKKEVSEPTYWMKKVRPGTFTWSVASIDRGGIPSEWSEKRDFSVGNVPVIEWADGKSEGKSFFVGVDPYATMHWDDSNTEVVRWRLKLAKEDDYRKTKKWIKMEASPFRKNVPIEGFYSARIQGINEAGVVIGQTSVRKIQVLEQPLLPAPRFAENIPEKLKATARGNLELQWTQVEGAAEYLIQLMDEDDKIIDRIRAQEVSKIIKSLKPGSYRVNVRALDQFGREGNENEARTVTVENKSDVRAPAFKKVKIRTFKSSK